MIDPEEPIGTIVLFEHIQLIPEGWMVCDGATLASADYAALFAAIGTTYGGDATNFKIPGFCPVSDTTRNIIRAT